MNLRHPRRHLCKAFAKRRQRSLSGHQTPPAWAKAQCSLSAEIQGRRNHRFIRVLPRFALHGSVVTSTVVAAPDLIRFRSRDTHLHRLLVRSISSIVPVHHISAAKPWAGPKSTTWGVCAWSLHQLETTTVYPCSATVRGWPGAAVVAGVQAIDVIEHRQHPHQPAADLLPDEALRLASASVGRAIKGSVVEAHVGQEREPPADLLEHLGAISRSVASSCRVAKNSRTWARTALTVMSPSTTGMPRLGMSGPRQSGTLCGSCTSIVSSTNCAFAWRYFARDPPNASTCPRVPQHHVNALEGDVLATGAGSRASRARCGNRPTQLNVEPTCRRLFLDVPPPAPGAFPQRCNTGIKDVSDPSEREDRVKVVDRTHPIACQHMRSAC